jgi:transposase
MSARELSRVEVLSRVKAGTLSLGSAATLMAVSYRQAKRLARRYTAEGAKGLKHRSAGSVSNYARPTAERERVVALVREKYSGPIDERFGPTLAAEHLASEDGVTCSTTRCAAGCWPPGCGVAPGNGRPIARGGSARRISANWCSSMVVFTCGTRPVPRAAA